MPVFLSLSQVVGVAADIHTVLWVCPPPAADLKRACLVIAAGLLPVSRRAGISSIRTEFSPQPSCTPAACKQTLAESRAREGSTPHPQLRRTWRGRKIASSTQRLYNGTAKERTVGSQGMSSAQAALGSAGSLHVI